MIALVGWPASLYLVSAPGGTLTAVAAVPDVRLLAVGTAVAMRPERLVVVDALRRERAREDAGIRSLEFLSLEF